MLQCARLTEEYADELACGTQLDPGQASKEDALMTCSALLRARAADPSPMASKQGSVGGSSGRRGGLKDACPAARTYMNGIETSESVLSRINSFSQQQQQQQQQQSDQAAPQVGGNRTATTSRPFSGLSGTGDTAEYTSEMKRRMHDRLATSGMEPKVKLACTLNRQWHFFCCCSPVPLGPHIRFWLSCDGALTLFYCVNDFPIGG
jgi:hypothetical protein